jgi:alpha-mannosidase
MAEGLESLFSVSEPGVLVTAAKRAELSEAVILRLHETTGRAARLRLSSRLPLAEVVAADALERRLGDGSEIPLRTDGTCELHIGAFEIKTLLVTARR